MMNKLRDRRGASLLMALLLLLLATMVSVVILTAVSSAARHLSRDREAELPDGQLCGRAAAKRYQRREIYPDRNRDLHL